MIANNGLAKIALSFLWSFSGLTSIFFAPEIGYKLLSDAGVSGLLADWAVYGGGLLDIALGIWLLSSKWLRLCCVIQIVLIVIYTLLLTIIDASYWLHPFGPLTKNIPIGVLILVVYKSGQDV